MHWELPLSLADHIKGLPDVVRESISTIGVALDGPRVVATFSICLFDVGGPGSRPQALQVGSYAIETAAATDLPTGVSGTTITRWPDIVRHLDPLASVEDQLREVHRSGVVGDLDMVRFTPDDGPPRWLAKTHAGSAEERRVWLMTHPSEGELQSEVLPRRPVPRRAAGRSSPDIGL